MILTVHTDFGDYIVPESVRQKIWGKVRLDGAADRRFKIAPAIDRYYRIIEHSMRNRWMAG